MATATLFVDSVTCIDEMGGSFRERFGNDEIYLATIGADTSGTHKQPFFEVYGNFDDGDVKRYSPPRPLVTVSAEGQAVLMLAERQLGGMNEALDTADKKLAEKIQAAKADGVVADGPADDAKTAALKALIEEALELIAAESKDKVFPPQLVTPVNPEGTATFSGFDGKYALKYHWEVAA